MTELNPHHTATSPASTLPPAIRRVALIGFMGAGKTSVGRLLAAELGWTFLDLDAHLEARAGRSVRAIFAADGEEVFRRLETQALAHALGTSETVLALGGGTPEQLGNCLLLEQTPGTLIVHLDAPFATLYDRCLLEELSARTPQAEADWSRPVLSSPSDAADRYRRRQPIYQRLAAVSISTGEQDAAAVVRELVETFSRI